MAGKGGEKEKQLYVYALCLMKQISVNVMRQRQPAVVVKDFR